MKYLVRFFGWIGIAILYVLYILWHFKLPTKKYKKYLRNNVDIISVYVIGIVNIAMTVELK
jgi:hypothetical protein